MKYQQLWVIFFLFGELHLQFTSDQAEIWLIDHDMVQGLLFRGYSPFNTSIIMPCRKFLKAFLFGFCKLLFFG